MKKVRSLLNLDLSLFRAAICGGVRAGADLPESPRRCPESCRSGGEYRDHAYNVLAAVVIICTAIGPGLGDLLLWGTGIVRLVFGVLFFAILAGTKR